MAVGRNSAPGVGATDVPQKEMKGKMLMATNFGERPPVVAPPRAFDRQELALRFVARAVEAIVMAGQMTDADFRAATYRTACRYFVLAIEEILKEKFDKLDG